MVHGLPRGVCSGGVQLSHSYSNFDGVRHAETSYFVQQHAWNSEILTHVALTLKLSPHFITTQRSVWRKLTACVPLNAPPLFLFSRWSGQLSQYYKLCQAGSGEMASVEAVAGEQHGCDAESVAT